MKRSAAVLFVLCLSVGMAARAQVVESATVRTFTINVGGMGSAFFPNDGNNPPYGSRADYLLGLGTYVDFHFSHWVQIEGEARWLRLHQYAGEHQDHYLVGPKVPIHQIGKMDFYGKALIGFGKMTFPNKYGYGTFTALAFGGGMDYKLSRKVTVRAVDFEYQLWPKFLPDATIRPYGVSVGMAYRVF
jgi:Outer membrane protein beta-barrel domain